LSAEAGSAEGALATDKKAQAGADLAGKAQAEEASEKDEADSDRGAQGKTVSTAVNQGADQAASAERAHQSEAALETPDLALAALKTADLTDSGSIALQDSARTALAADDARNVSLVEDANNANFSKRN